MVFIQTSHNRYNSLLIICIFISLHFFFCLFVQLLMAFSKFLTVTFIINLAVSSLASQFVQDDILAFPRYKVILTNEKISKANFKDVEVLNNILLLISN